MDEDATDPFLDFARKIDSVEEAKKAVASTPTKKPTSKIEEVVDNFITLAVEEKARRAIVKAELDAYKDYLGSIAKGSTSDTEFEVELEGTNGAVMVTGKPSVRWDQDMLRSMDTGDTPPPEMSVSYKPKPSHVEDPIFAPAKKSAGTRIGVEVLRVSK